MILRTAENRLGCLFASCLLAMSLSACSLGAGCRGGRRELWRMPIETLFDQAPDPVGSVHRIQGTYKEAYELAGRITVCLPGDDLCDARSSVNMTDYCVAFDSKGCVDELAQATKARGSFAHSFPSFGFVDVVVEYVSHEPQGGCSLGVIKVLNILQASPVTVIRHASHN
jgi:hypothetical protein